MLRLVATNALRGPGLASISTLQMTRPMCIYRDVRVKKPVITIPVKIHERAAKFKIKQRLKLMNGPHPGDKSRCVIKCRLESLNHYQKQCYSHYKSLPLAAKHWKGRKSVGDFMTILPFMSPSYKVRPEPGEENGSFEQFYLDQRLLDALTTHGFGVPTNIQVKAIPQILQGKHTLIASETGNGKTLAFLVPLIQQILAFKESEVKSSSSRRPCSPWAMIATPGKELAEQIGRVAEYLGANIGIKIMVATGSMNPKKMALYGKREDVDLVVGSFGTLDRLVKLNYLQTKHVKHVVYDEVDTILDDTFSRLSVPFLSMLKGNLDFQITLVGATMPQELGTLLKDVFPAEDLEQVTTPMLHYVLPHVRQKFWRVAKKHKTAYLLSELEHDIDKNKKVLIFCNKTSTANFVKHFLIENNIPCVSVNKHMTPENRQKDLDRFLRGEVSILSSTDVLSRGIDTKDVHHVINYDFPFSTSDYIHRVGRLGRVGSQQYGYVTNFVHDSLQVCDNNCPIKE